MERMLLGEACAIFRGVSVKSNIHQSRGNYISINVSNIHDGGILVTDNSIIAVEDNKKYALKKYEITSHDVVVACRGTILKCAYVPDLKENDGFELYMSNSDKELLQQYTLVASANVLVIRCNNCGPLLPKYLNIVLNLPIGIEMLERVNTGKTSITINPSALANITLPLLSISEQGALIMKYERELLERNNGTQNWETQIMNLNDMVSKR